MSQNNIARFVKISNFRNLGINEKPQTICINHSTNPDYIGNLILLVGPHNAGKTNLLNALNLLNENLAFNSNDLPNAIKNATEGTYIKLFDEPNDGQEIITKFTNGEKNPPHETFSEWKEGVRRWIESKLDKLMPNYGYKDQLQFIASGIPKIYWNNQEYSLVSNFFMAIDNWVFDDFTKNKWWEKDFGKIEFKSRTPYFNNNLPTSYEVILNQELIDYLNKLIELDNQRIYPLLSNSTKTFNIQFYKYHPWKINNSFFQTKYKGEWNEFFTNLFNKLGIKQQDIIHGIWGKQRYYEQKVKDGLKQISDCFNNLFHTNGYLYEFALFFNEETISFEINLVKQDSNEMDNNKIIPCLFDEQSVIFQSLFNLYFGLLIGKAKHLKSGDVILMDEPIGNLQVASSLQLHQILKNFVKTTGISIVLSTQNIFLIDFDYLDEICLVDNINGISTINNYFTFNQHPASTALQAIITSLFTYPNFLFKCHDPVYLIVNKLSDYNYLTGYKLYKLNELTKEIKNADDNEKLALKQLFHQYERLIFIPIDFSYFDNNMFENIVFSNNRATNNKLIIANEQDINLLKNINHKQIINCQQLISDLKDVNQNELVFESLISNEDQKIFCLDKQNDNYVNNTITFKYAMINIKASNQTYKNFDTFFNNLLKEINSNKKE